MKTLGRILIIFGWVLLVISVMVLVVTLQQPRYRDPNIQSLLNRPSITALTYTIAVIIGFNFPSILACLFGVWAAVRKNPNGKALILASVIMFLVNSTILFLPSSELAGATNNRPIVVTLPQSEFTVTFPHPAKKKVVTAAGFESIAYESEGSESTPYLRAEFMQGIVATTIANNFRAILEDHARLAGLSLPVITETENRLGKVGTYSGIKKVGDYTMKVYGTMVLGESSAINCMVVEHLELSPSKDSLIFLASIKRKPTPRPDVEIMAEELSRALEEISKENITKDMITNSIGMKLVYIPAGSFMMGSSHSATQLAAEYDAKEVWFMDQFPQHQLRISEGFWMGQTEVTQGQFKSIMNTEPWSGWSNFQQSSNNAASYINWDHAAEFCRKLSQAEGMTYRLPTEAEWEYACRANTRTRFSFGDSDSSFGEYGWFAGNANLIGEYYAHAVGQKKPNAFGLYDMHGNVWEWCSDWYNEDYYSKSPRVDPQGPSSGDSRVLRGGSWLYNPRACRSANRHWEAPYIRSGSNGFRVVRSQS